MKTIRRFLFLFLAVTLSSALSEALEIKSIQGKDVTLLFREELNAPYAGQQFLVVDGKTDNDIGIIEVTLIGRRQAKARLLRGRISRNDYLLEKESSPAMNEDDAYPYEGRASSRGRRRTYRSTLPSDSLFSSIERGPSSEAIFGERPSQLAWASSTGTGGGGFDNFGSKSSWDASDLNVFSSLKLGFGLGFSPLAMTVASASGIRNLEGMNFVAKSHLSLDLKKVMAMDFGISWMPLSANAEDSVLGTAKFRANYLAFDGIARINFWKSAISGPWVGGGLNYFYLLSGTSNLIRSSSIGSEIFLQLSAGINKQMSKEYFCYRFDYLLRPFSSNSTGAVDTTQFIISGIYYY